MKDIRIRISLFKQRLYLLKEAKVLAEYSVSTAKNGPGELYGSGCTPRGLHQVNAMIGANAELNTVFVGRFPSGEIYTPILAARYPQRDWILTRILWLAGLEPDWNLFGDRDTLRRYIYIHGCPAELPLGVPLSHGCIRMANEAIIELFEQVKVGDKVLIVDA
jgi:L,D-transpeptidase YbiS